MDNVQTVILALLQGITEFLPISSSAHLILPSQMLGWKDQGLAFDVAVHIGTLGAVLLYFRKDLHQMVIAWLHSMAGGPVSDQSRMIWYVLLATIPAVIIGFLINGVWEATLRQTVVIAATTLIFGVLLYVSDRWGARQRTLKQFNARDALWIGIAQVLALIPGTSRSGVTITAALALGLDRTAAARFSFLLAIPIISAAGLLKLLDLLANEGAVDWFSIALGTTVSFVSAFFCIGWFLTMIEKIGLLPFVIYRLVLGLILLFFFV